MTDQPEQIWDPQDEGLPSAEDMDSIWPSAPEDTSIIEPSLTPIESSRLRGRAPAEGYFAKLVDEGFAALKRGDRETARACWTEALKMDPTDRMLKLNLRKLDTKGRP